MILAAAALRRSFGHEALFGPMDDEAYFLIPKDYLLGEFLPFWKKLKAAIGMVYRPGRTDCDDFVSVFKAEIIKAALTIDTDAAPAVGIARVVNLHPTLGIAAGNHMLNFIGTPAGWIMFDPITDLHVPLENYPARLVALAI